MTPAVVFDTNVIVSAALDTRRDVGFPGRPSLCLRLALSGHADIVLSAALVEEYRSVLLRPKFGFPKREVRDFVRTIQRAARSVIPATIPALAVRDAGDRMVLATAIAGKCTYLVTGNRRHFPDAHRETAIVTPAEFLTAILEQDQI